MLAVVRVKVPAGNASFFSNRSAFSGSKPSKAMHVVAGFSDAICSDSDTDVDACVAAVADGGATRIRSGMMDTVSVDAVRVREVPE